MMLESCPENRASHVDRTGEKMKSRELGRKFVFNPLCSGCAVGAPVAFGDLTVLSAPSTTAFRTCCRTD